ncbi:MAG: dynamin family protein, partial [Aggregatilineales bacterium]
MAETGAENKLLHAYEGIRQREYELISGLLDIIPKINNIDEERISQVRDALFHADHPFLMVFVGPFSSGKSSIINAMMGDEALLRIGPTPTTDRINILRWGEEAQTMDSAGDTNTVFYPSSLLRKVSLVDTPGLESIFQNHEDTTRNFLHRSDVVLLVMLATQAMSQSNLEYLQSLREYGKKIIILINQADLLSEDEKATVKEYVENQSKDRLGYQPPVWMVSAKMGLEAQSTPGGRDDALWQQSGLHNISNYIEKQLSDTERLRQKLQTPLQIVQNVHQTALTAVRENQTTFDAYRNITDNIDGQLGAQKRGQEKSVREIMDEVDARFKDTSNRSEEAIHDIFQFSRALGSLGRGLTELTGISRLFRRSDKPSYTQTTFQQHRVFEPLKDLPTIVDKLGPRLEGQDMQDIDDLVKYGQREVNALPGSMQTKVIGEIQAPIKYDRSALYDMREDLNELEREASVLELDNLDRIRRNTLLYLAVWEVIVLILIIALLNTWGAVNSSMEAPIGFMLLIVLLGAAVGGFALIPIRGRMIHNAYIKRLQKIQSKYDEMVKIATDKQIEYGMQLRRDTIQPLARL